MRHSLHRCSLAIAVFILGCEIWYGIHRSTALTETPDSSCLSEELAEIDELYSVQVRNLDGTGELLFAAHYYAKPLSPESPSGWVEVYRDAQGAPRLLLRSDCQNCSLSDEQVQANIDLMVVIERELAERCALQLAAVPVSQVCRNLDCPD